MSEDFVTPERHRLTLADGQYVDITKRLNHGEAEDLNERIWPGGGFNRRMVRTARIVAYVLGWSLTKDGAPVPYSLELPEQTRIDTVRALSQDRAVEIFKAIEAHEEAMAQERTEKKRIPAGSPDGAAISSSPSAVTGPSAGSASST